MNETNLIAPKSLARFATIWFGEMISVIGSSISEFALSIWVYKTTGSVLQFSLMLLAMVIPRLVMSFVAGVIVDRMNRRTIMILSDCAQAVLSLCVLGLIFFNVLQPWHLFIVVALTAIAASFQGPAYQALVSQLVSKDDLGKANGMLSLAGGAAQLLGPLLGGVLLGGIGLLGVVLIDFVTFLVAMLMVSLVPVPNVRPLAPMQSSTQPAGEAAAPTSFAQEFRAGWQFIAQRPNLLSLMFYIAITVFLTSFLQVLTPPMVLAFNTEQSLGIILAVGGIGVLVGSLVMSAWGGPKRRVYGLLAFDVLTAVAMIMAGLQTSVIWLCVVAFLFFASLPFSRGSAQSLWQSVVPEHLQGRVFTARDTIAIAASPIALLLAGPLADGVFQPLMKANGALANSVGAAIGIGPGRGIALMFIVLGVLFLLVNLAAWLSPRLRKI